MNGLYAVLTIAYRDFLKLLRDRPRLISSFIFPILFIGVLGGSLQGSFSGLAGFDFLPYVFTGILAQTLFQSSASGVISLIEDRENDFSQEIFVSPVSRYAIVLGKILGETLVSLTQGVGIILFGLVIGWLMGTPIAATRLLAVLPAAVAACFLGGAFGILVVANLSSQRTANQIFPFIIFPQFFLAGVFNPLRDQPLVLDLLSRLVPLRYAVDLVRDAFYAGTPEYPAVVLAGPATNLAIMAAMFGVFLVSGTFLFVRGERNR